MNHPQESSNTEKPLNLNKSDIEQLLDLCNSAIEQEKLGNMRPMTDEELKWWRFIGDTPYVPILRLGEFVVLKPKKEL